MYLNYVKVSEKNRLFSVLEIVEHLEDLISRS
jgi:hypothetical protein